MDISRRDWLAGAAVSSAAGPDHPLTVDTHIHLFSEDQRRFPYHRNATYRPPAAPLPGYLEFARQAGISHAVIVHPEPYQDDHSYLEYCFAHEPSPLFFKGTCLFDPLDPATAGRIRQLAARNPKRIVGLRIHCNRARGVAPATSGAIRDRDLRDPRVKVTLGVLQDLRMAAQFHIIPYHAAAVLALAAEFPGVQFILDHLARSGAGTPAEYAHVIEMGRLKNVVMKFSGVAYSSQEPYPHADARALVRQTYDAFGPDRMIWGGLGQTAPDYRKQTELFEQMFAFASAGDRNKIRGGNAMRLFWA